MLRSFVWTCLCCSVVVLATEAADAIPQSAKKNLKGFGAASGRLEAIGGTSSNGSTNKGGSANKGSANKGSGAKPKFVSLLDSKDLSAFRGYQSEPIGAGWQIKGKTLHFDGSEGAGDIITKQAYSDFDLQFEWKISEGGNSGVMYRVGLGDPAPYFSGVEYQVLDDSAHADGKNKATSAGAIYALYPPKEYKKKEVGIWNKARITVKGSMVTHYLNGSKIAEADLASDEWKKKVADSKFKDWEKFSKLDSGHIAFQDHGNEVWYRKIRIKDLSGSAGSGKKGSGKKGSASKGSGAKVGAGSLQQLGGGLGVIDN